MFSGPVLEEVIESVGVPLLTCLGAIFRVREGGALADDCEGELVVSLGDECYRVAVPGLELKLASGVCTAATC